jgi:indole-3-glycerol phosphate synthase
VATYLDAILAAHRARAATDRRDPGELEALAKAAPPVRDFAGAIRAAAALPGEIAIISEVKRRSPSKGDLAIDLDPIGLALCYERAGAAALSVLTDTPHFGGSADDLIAARSAVLIPALRKDFTVQERDLYDARAMGADAALLIVAGLEQDELASFIEVAERLGLCALVEVHDEKELARAIDAGASVIGVNQRDLHTFEVDTDRAVRVGEAMPDHVVRIAESGVRSPADTARLKSAGFHAVLVGEALVTATDPGAQLVALRTGPRRD